MAVTIRTKRDVSPVADDPTVQMAPARRLRRPRAAPAAPPSGEPVGDSLSVAAHPRAARRVRQARDWSGLVGFLLGGYLSLPTHTLLEAGLRALVAGVVLYLVAWGAAVLLWRYLVVAELKSAEHALVEAMVARSPRSDEPSPPVAGRSRARRGE